MADLSLVTDNFFPTASETFTDNLSSSISAGATTVPVNSAVEYATGAVVVLTVEPGTVNEATFIGEKDTTNQFINCIWTEGNVAVGHSVGATIIDYDSATHFNALSKGVQQFANQDGSLKSQPVRDALGLSAASANGWEASAYTFQAGSGYYAGNRVFDISVANQDVRSVLSQGMKLRFDRGTVPPTQCVDLESSSSQYASRASGSLTGSLSTVTDDITIEAWTKIESYPTTNEASIIGRRDANNGWSLRITIAGRLNIFGGNAGNFDTANSQCALPKHNWTHVAATLDMSAGASTMYLNGVSINTAYSNGSATAWANAGNLELGRDPINTRYFDGKLSDVRVWNAVRTSLQIRDNMYQTLAGSETNLVGYWKLAGDFNDSTSAANHLAGQGGAVATDVDHPFNATEYCEILKVSYSAPNSTIKVRVPEGFGIPNQSLTSAYYSAQANPYNYPFMTNTIAEMLIGDTSTATTITAIAALAIPTVYIAKGQRVKITVHDGIGTSHTNTASQARLSAWDGAVSSGTQLAENAFSTATTNQLGHIQAIYEGQLPEGDHSINAGLRAVGAGTVTLNGDPLAMGFIKVELQKG